LGTTSTALVIESCVIKNRLLHLRTFYRKLLIGTPFLDD
jgi:hypothetical protein